MLAGLTVPFVPGSNVIVYVFAVHCAYNVVSDVGVYGLSIFIPPVVAVYHPLNVYPGFVGVGNVIAFGV